MANLEKEIFHKGRTINATSRAIGRTQIRSFYFLFLSVIGFFLSQCQPLHSQTVNDFEFEHISSTSLSLEWDEDNNEYYVIVLSTVPGFSINISSGRSGLEAETTSFINLQPNTSHTILIKESDDKDTKYIALSTYTKAVSPGITGFQIFATSAILTINSGANNIAGISGSTTSLTLQNSTGTGGNFNVSLSSNGKASALNTHFVISGLTPNTAYSFQTRALNFKQLPSSATIVTESTQTLPALPTLTSFQLFTTSVSITLGQNGNPAGTPVMISTGLDGNFSVTNSSVGVIGGENTTLSIQNLSANTAYNLQAGIWGSNTGSSTQTILVSASTATFPITPGDSSFSAVNATSITITWERNGNPLEPATTYQVQFSAVNDFSNTTTSNVITNQLTAVALVPNVTYYFKVAALGRTGFVSGFNTVVSTATQASSSGPNLPTGFSVSAIGISSVTFIWTDNSDNEEGYRILNSTDGVLAALSPNTVSYSLTGLTNNQLVSARIACYNSAGVSTGALTISSYTLASAPGVPLISAVKRKKVELSWNNNSNPSSVRYEVFRSSDNFSTDISTLISVTDLLTISSAAVTKLIPGTTYYFRVRAQNSSEIPTSFSSVVSTYTPLQETEISDGNPITTGDIDVTADAGVKVTNNTLADGRTQQVIIATKSANASYSNGFKLELTSGSQVSVIASSNSLEMVNSQTVPIMNDEIRADISAGTTVVKNILNTYSYNLTNTLPDAVITALSKTISKSVSVTLNPQNTKIQTIIPPETLVEQSKIHIKTLDQFPPLTSFGSPSFIPTATLAAPSVMKTLGKGIEINAEKNSVLVKPIDVNITYNSSDIEGLDVNTLVVARYESPIKKWLALPSTIFQSTQTVTGTTIRLSRFQLMALAPATTIDRPAVYPNPLRLHCGQTDMTFTNLTAHAAVKIYSYAGELVRELKTDSSGITRWDAKNSYGEIVGSDVYVALIESGNNEKKKLKIAVEK